MIPDSFDNMAVLFVGVGGQGVITAADVVTEAAFLEGMDVKQTEIHGLSRRFGSVSSQVHVGRETLSPLRGKGAVDLMLQWKPMKHCDICLTSNAVAPP